jgi:3-oxoacyl-(acyl-carrier-protein) synthase
LSGHLEAAAGIAGLTKIILQMKYKKIAATLHAERVELNPARRGYLLSECFSFAGFIQSAVSC